MLVFGVDFCSHLTICRIAFAIDFLRAVCINQLKKGPSKDVAIPCPCVLHVPMDVDVMISMSMTTLRATSISY